MPFALSAFVDFVKDNLLLVVLVGVCIVLILILIGSYLWRFLYNKKLAENTQPALSEQSPKDTEPTTSPEEAPDAVLNDGGDAPEDQPTIAPSGNEDSACDGANEADSPVTAKKAKQPKSSSAKKIKTDK